MTMQVAGHAKAGPVEWTRAERLARFGVIVVTALLLLIAALEVWLLTDAIRHGVTTAVGIDIDQYLRHADRWLHGGSWYLPQQLAGPYVVEAIEGNVYPPTLLYLVAPFALGLPMPLWYLTPVALVAFTYWRHRPAWWAWPIIALALVYPRTWTVLLYGNPAMWAIAFAVAGTQWGAMAWGAAFKLTFAPLVLVGLHDRRSWLIGGAVALALAIPFGSLWLDYLTVMHNTASSRGLEYVLGEWPIAIALVVAGTSARIRTTTR